MLYLASVRHKEKSIIFTRHLNIKPFYTDASLCELISFGNATTKGLASTQEEKANTNIELFCSARRITLATCSKVKASGTIGPLSLISTKPLLPFRGKHCPGSPKLGDNILTALVWARPLLVANQLLPFPTR